MKYPNLQPLEARVPWFSGAKRADVIRDAREVCRRCDCRAWLNTSLRAIVFGRERADGSIDLFEPMVRVVRPGGGVGGLDPVTDPLGLDEIVTVINYAKAPRERKERWAAQWRDRREHEKREMLGAAVEENQRRVEETVNRQYDEHSMGRHYRRSVLVP